MYTRNSRLANAPLGILVVLVCNSSVAAQTKSAGQTRLSPEAGVRTHSLYEKLCKKRCTGEFEAALQAGREICHLLQQSLGAGHWKTQEAEWRVKTLQKCL